MRTEYHIDENGCWIWQKCRNNRGYGLKWDRATRRLMVAHRWYYERARGPIPTGLQIDHLCNVKVCVNVAHLEAVTPQVNTQRAFALREKVPAPVRERPVVRTVDPRECILWKGCRDRDGYGATWINGKRVMAHRWAYERAFGPIPSGMQIDHLCRNRACCNPCHLEAISRLENIRRAAWRDACKRGHAMTPANTSWQSGRRKCRACHVEACARSRQRKRDARQRQRESVGGVPGRANLTAQAPSLG
jgi:HNH endonuclease